MSRPLKTWLAFGLCVFVAVVATAWVSFIVLDLERQQHESQQDAIVEENVRLALWRMDSAAGAMLAEENGRPYFTYRPFYAAETAYTRMYNELNYGQVLIPSPLLTFESPYVLLHFQFGPAGNMSSPQAPTSNDRDLAEAKYSAHEKVVAATQHLEQLRAQLDRSELAAVAGQVRPRLAAVFGDRVKDIEPSQIAQALQSQVEFQSRQEQQRANVERQVVVANTVFNPKAAAATVDQGMMHAAWTGDLLVLVRRVTVNGDEYLQGCRLDWNAIRSWLLDEVRDLLPDAKLEPVPDAASAISSRMLVSLPVRLIPGTVDVQPVVGMSPLRLSLIIVWVCGLGAAAAVAALLRSAMALSERRGAFVSAVTHELRTPLTTFRMYTDMLSRGMVKDESQRRSYLDTLRREADRLTHLVGNVLSYARLEKVRKGADVEAIALGPLLDRVNDRLADRARDAGMTLDRKVDDEAWSAMVVVNAGGIEQILFNLVDNACKYAADADDETIHLDARLDTAAVVVRVCDHGPGVSPAVKARLFQPFSKSSQAAANSAPGVGLGLALAKRYANDMGARLKLAADADRGACFELALPLAR